IYTAETARGTTASFFNAGSLLTAGNDLTLSAGRDVGVIGSLARAGNDVSIHALNDVNLLPGRESHTSEYSRKKSSVGLWNSLGEVGVGSFAGMKSQTQGVERAGEYTAGSLISAGRDTVIGAGRDLNQTNSQIEAGRDVVIAAARDWNMLAGQDYDSLHQYVTQVQGGINAVVRQNVSGATRTFLDLPQNAMRGQGNVAFQGLTAASAYLKAVDSLKSAASQPISASVNVGASFSRSDYKASGSAARPSALIAGRDVEAAAGRDITINGGKVAAGENVILDAARDLTIVAAFNRDQTEMTSVSGGTAIGVKAVVGSGGVSFGINAQANAAGAASEGRGTSHTNALITAGNTFYGKSGRDMTVAGARIEADRTWMDVGNNLTVASVQDSYESKSHSWSAGADVTVGYGVHVDVQLGFGKGSSASDWTGEQTAVIGRREVDIYVDKETSLKGAIIATDKGGDLTLNTGTLSYEAIADRNTSKAWNAGVSAGFSLSGGFAKPEQGAPAAPMKPIPMDFIGSGVSEGRGERPYTPTATEFGYSSAVERGVLRPTVTEGTIIVRDDPDADLSGLNRDLDRAREITGKEKTHVDVYVPKLLLDALLDGKEMLSEHKELQEQYGFLPNLFPGMFINRSITGQETYKLDKNLEYELEEGKRIKNEKVDGNSWTSDQSPALRLLYHLVPGVKSLSEIHDRQMQVYKEVNGQDAPSWYTQVTIPGSFSKSYLGALIGILDIRGWESGWNDHIKPSYTLRTGSYEEGGGK
ncbi:MAG: hemagglutinin repeat-containing protein, partial [Desulfovibrio sp.]|nr:hemagglutinin repeat-containing protein [Desulfovibrio sp.]